MSETTFDAFLFYRSYRESLRGMTQKDQLATLLAIIDYALYGVEPNLKGKMPAAIFTVARPIIDSNNAKRKAGKKGGRPKKKTNGFSESETIGFESEEPIPLFNEEHRNIEIKNEEQRECGADKPPKRPRFAPPDVSEVETYCSERKNGIDPAAFIDYYSARGWKLNGGQTMKDWRAAVRTWERRNKAEQRGGTEDDYWK